MFYLKNAINTVLYVLFLLWECPLLSKISFEYMANFLTTSDLCLNNTLALEIVQKAPPPTQALHILLPTFILYLASSFLWHALLFTYLFLPFSSHTTMHIPGA